MEHVVEAKLLWVPITKTMNYGQHIDIVIAKSNRRITFLVVQTADATPKQR